MTQSNVTQFQQPPKVVADLDAIIDEDRKAITDEALAPHYAAMTETHAKLVQCREHRHKATDEIARLRAELSGWERFDAYQAKREPALQRRYETARDYVRATEDEQAGIL